LAAVFFVVAFAVAFVVAFFAVVFFAAAFLAAGFFAAAYCAGFSAGGLAGSLSAGSPRKTVRRGSRSLRAVFPDDCFLSDLSGDSPATDVSFVRRTAAWPSVPKCPVYARRPASATRNITRRTAQKVSPTC
jgi:hypothetical protein